MFLTLITKGIGFDFENLAYQNLLLHVCIEITLYAAIMKIASFYNAKGY